MLSETILVLFVVILIGIFTTMAWAALSAAPFVPLWKKDVRRMLKLAAVKPDDVVYDLGAGDGRIVVAAAQKFGARAIGFEISILPFLLAWFKVLLAGQLGRVSIKPRNFYKEGLEGAQVVTCFLTPMAMRKLEPKFKRELKPGTRVVSYAFSLPSKKPDVVDKPSPKTTAIYLYRY